MHFAMLMPPLDSACTVNWRQPDSATAQFFINVVDNHSLDYPNMGGYAVFGKVISGMDVVDKIKAVPTTTKNGMPNVPATPVVIESVRVKK